MEGFSVPRAPYLHQLENTELECFPDQNLENWLHLVRQGSRDCGYRTVGISGEEGKIHGHRGSVRRMQKGLVWAVGRCYSLPMTINIHFGLLLTREYRSAKTDLRTQRTLAIAQLSQPQ